MSDKFTLMQHVRNSPMKDVLKTGLKLEGWVMDEERWEETVFCQLNVSMGDFLRYK